MHAVADVDHAGGSKQVPVAGVASRHDTIEQVDAAQHRRDDVLRAAHSHQVAGTVRRQVRHQGLENPQPLFLRLTDGQATHRQAGEVELQQRLQRSQTQRLVHAALHDPEQPPGRSLCVVASVAPHRPAHGAFHGLASLWLRRRIRCAVVQGHGDVGAQLQLHLHRVLGIQAHLAAVDRRAEQDTLLRDLAQALQAEDLKSARVRQNGMGPVHERMQPAVGGDDVWARTQQQMKGVAEDDLRAEPLELLG